MNFYELRENYSSIIYKNFKCAESGNEIKINYLYKLGEFDFNHELIIPKKYFFHLENMIDKDVFLFNLGLIEIINYYKLACPKKIVLEAGAIKEEQKEFFKKLFYKGLGEFRYINNIDISMEEFLEFVNTDENYYRKSKLKGFEGNIVPVGGGKDSIVTLELLKHEKEKNNCLIVNPRGATIDTVNVAGYNMENTIEIFRKIDPKLLELNKQGYLNGHVPFSAMLAFLGIFCALITNKQYVILSNESSADESTDEVTGANHQYSKSMEFEKDFSNYVEKYINSDIKYFSLLRGMREIDIARLFSEHKQYHKIFRSCNVGSKNGGNDWCGSCPKCLFVYIMLAPYLEKEELINIFGKDLLEDTELLTYLKQLTGIEKVKPFECVGTRDEVNEAIDMIIKKYEEIPTLIRMIK
ncbi:MAG: hypothetical protein E7314_04580 [Clostridiales bacterium]|nr:hypothetical protein [Clostridiales bacterium]